jgi:UPF0716 family protein affecting phage T7 exclusion
VPTDPSHRRASTAYLALVAAEILFFVWLGWHRGQLAEFTVVALAGALALYGASYAAASSARMAKWMRNRSEGGDDPPSA